MRNVTIRGSQLWRGEIVRFVSSEQILHPLIVHSCNAVADVAAAAAAVGVHHVSALSLKLPLSCHTHITADS